jgi:ADP-ribose diphosphatase
LAIFAQDNRARKRGTPLNLFRYIGFMAKKEKLRASNSGKKSRAKILESRVTYRGPVFYVTSETVCEPGGIMARRDVVRHSGSVVVLAVDGSGKNTRVLLAKQFRHAANREMLELPAGRIDPGETALQGAKRELMEETGYQARKWSKALHFYVSPGFLDETMTIFLAEGLTAGEATPEEDEVIRPSLVPLAKAVDMVMTGRIPDAKTIAGVLWYEKIARNA